MVNKIKKILGSKTIESLCMVISILAIIIPELLTIATRKQLTHANQSARITTICLFWFAGACSRKFRGKYDNKIREYIDIVYQIVCLSIMFSVMLFY